MSSEPQVRLVTSSDLSDLAVDDRELLSELRSRGIRAEATVWDDPAVDWSEAPLCVLRSVYDYHLRRDEFLGWVQRVAGETTLCNDPDTVRWNSHKSYLKDLASTGIPVIDTAWIAPGTDVDVGLVCREQDWTEAVVKPAVSASAYQTLRFTTRDTPVAQLHAEELLRLGDVMIQPYLREIETVGETSIIWLGGRRTHAVRRPSGLHSTLEEARRGASLVATEVEIEFARRVYERIQPEPLYARVDIVTSERFGLVLLELELIEPALYLRHAPAPVIVFADAIVGMLDGGTTDSRRRGARRRLQAGAEAPVSTGPR